MPTSCFPQHHLEQGNKLSKPLLEIDKYYYSGGMSVKPGLHNGRLEQHIHFWLGEEASTDEVPLCILS